MEDFNDKKTLPGCYQIEDIFESFQEYQHYLLKALATFQDMKKSRNPSFKAFVPEYLEIEFASIKSPRLYYPRYKSTIVVQLPEAGLSPKQKGTVRAEKLMEYSPLVKIKEVYMGDEFAMRIKILSPEKSKRIVRRNKKKNHSTSQEQGT